MKIPIAETFHSIQGEGFWQGTPMHFIRLAGCSVGKPWYATAAGDQGDPAPNLPNGKPAWLCHTWDNRPFWCDTDFSKYEERSIEHLISQTYEDHICITGGEPLIHPREVQALIDLCETNKKTLHIETSGTIFYDLIEDNVWITVSPKLGCLPDMIENADEIKLLIDSSFTESSLPRLVYEREHIFIQPIAPVDRPPTQYNENLSKCYELLKKHPNWRLSIQLHKLLGLR